MQQADIFNAYDENTHYVIVRAFRNLDDEAIPAVLVPNHGPFAWGADAKSAAHTAMMVEEIARTAYFTSTLNHEAQAIEMALHDKHYLRKHGSTAYYGQSVMAKEIKTSQ